MRSIAAIIATVLFLCAVWSRSLAWEIPKSQSDLYLPVGVNLGSAIDGYGDALWDFEEEAVRSSGGLQAGFAVAGLEAGALLKFPFY